MDISTPRFGKVSFPESDIISFQQGLIGLEDCQRWVLLADAHNSALGWMQCVDRPEIALAVVSPRRFVPSYQIRVASRDLSGLGLASLEAAQVLTIVGQVNDSLTLNLKAPLVVHVEHRQGRQVIAKDDHAVQYELGQAIELRKTA